MGRLKDGLAIFLCIIIAQADASSLNISPNVFVTSTAELPCLALELGTPVFNEEKVFPLEIEVVLKVDMATEYDQVYGHGAHKAQSHEAHYRCAAGFIATLEPITENALWQLQSAIDIRKKETSTDTRQGRAVSLPAALSVSSLIATGAFSLYFGMTIKELENYVSSLDEKLDYEQNFSDTIASNTKIIGTRANVLALRTNIISASFNSWREVTTCNLYKIVAGVERNRLYGRMDGLVTDIISGKMTTRVIPLDLLTKIATETKLLEGSLMEKNPLDFYTTTAISLMSVNPTKHSFRILIAVPKIPSTPSFVSLNILSPKALVARAGKMVSVQLHEPQEMFLPIRYATGETFPLHNSTAIESLRLLSGCQQLAGKKICRNSFPAPKGEIDCLKAIMTNETSDGTCHTTRMQVKKPPAVSLAHGDSGIVINAPDSYSVYGADDTGRPHRLYLATTHSNRRYCIYAPSRYGTITLNDGNGGKEVLQQTIQTTATLSQATSEASFYYLNAGDAIPEEMTTNLTTLELTEMIRRETGKYSNILNTGLSMELLLITAMAVMLLTTIAIVVGIKKGWISITIPGSEDQRPDRRRNRCWP